MQTKLDKEICSCEQQGHFVSINDKIIRVPEGYVVMFETGDYMGSDLKPGDMVYSRKSNGFELLEHIHEEYTGIDSRTCVIRRYIPEEVKRLVDVAQRHFASQEEDDTIIKTKENDEPMALPDEYLKEDVRCLHEGCEDYSDVQNNNCERVFDITRCTRARYSYNNNGIKPSFDEDDGFDDDDEFM